MTSNANSHPPKHTEAELAVIRRFKPTLDALSEALATHVATVGYPGRTANGVRQNYLDMVCPHQRHRGNEV